MKKIIFTILLVILYLLWFYFDCESVRKSRNAYLADINISIVDLKKRVSFGIDSITATSFLDWGLIPNRILEERNRKKIVKKETKIENNKEIKQTKRVICLGSKCWEFLGVVGIDKETIVTLLSKDKKSKLETFKIGDKLLENLTILDINQDEMILKNIEIGQSFILKIFEVNALDYAPKEKKVINE